MTLLNILYTHRYAGRDSNSDFLALAVELRRLRNLLEDIEERSTYDASLDRTSYDTIIQVLQCKAILRGVDLNFQSFHQNVQPEIILASKASLQVAIRSLSTAFDNISRPQDGRKTGLSGRSDPIDTCEPSPPVSSTDDVESSTDATFDSRGPIEKTSLIGLHPAQSSEPLPDRIEEGDKSAGLSLSSTRVSPSYPAMPAKWPSPFAFPDPLAFDDSKAYTILTTRSARPTPIVPTITINSIDDTRLKGPLPSNAATDDSALDNRPYETQSSLSSGPKRRDSKLPKPPVDERYSTASESLPTTMFVPYRPWFKPLNHVDSESDLNETLYPGSHQSEAHSKDMRAPAASFELDAGISGLSRTSVEYGMVSPVICEDQCERSTLKHRIPPMPSRAPPKPPPKVTKDADTTPPIPSRTPPRLPRRIIKDKDKPPIPPRRRDHCLASSSLLAMRKYPSKGAFRASAPPSYRVDALSGADIQRAVKHHTVPKRRASTGEVHLGTLLNTETDKRKKDSIYRTARATDSLHVQANGMCRPSSSSAPELTIPNIELSVASGTPDLATEPAVQLSDLCDTDITTTKTSEDTAQIVGDIHMRPATNRIFNICESFNQRDWLRAESFLTVYLCEVKAPYTSDLARRIRHLLGVCASYLGHWHRAIVLFISVVNKPVRKLKYLDDGDKAALYWLGDAYSVLNRQEEALLAYCLAGSCSQGSSTPQLPGFHRCLLAAQEQLRQIVPKSSFKTIWASESFRSGEGAEDEILHCTIVSQAAAQMSLQSWSSRPERCSFHGAIKGPEMPQQNDGSALHRLSVSPAHLEPDYNWPMPSDPTFDLQSVARGILTVQQIDVLDKMQLFPETLHYESKLWPSLGGFTCNYALHLVNALRESFQTLAMAWSEAVDSNGVFFSARYYSVQDQIFTVRYFRLQVVKLSILEAYGVSVCSDSICSARTTSTDQNANQRLEAATKKELRRCLRSTIKATYKQQRQADKILSLNPPPPPPPLPPPPSRPPFVLESLPEIRISPIVLGSIQSTPRSSSVNLTAFPAPPMARESSSPPETIAKELDIAERTRARMSARSSSHEMHLLGPLIR